MRGFLSELQLRLCVVLLAGGVTEQLRQVNKLLQFTVAV